jgi:hypothetical protein
MIPQSEVIFSLGYHNKDLTHLLGDDIIEAYIKSLPEEYQEAARKKHRDDLEVRAAQWRHWIYSCEEARSLGYTVDEKNRVGGLYAVAIVDSVRSENTDQPVVDLAKKHDLFWRVGWDHRGKEWENDIENINGWRRINENAILVLAGDYHGHPNRMSPVIFWGSVGILWAPTHLVEKYQGDGSAMPIHLI